MYFQAWNNLALELSAAGQADEAERVFRRLVNSNPEHVVVFTDLATLLSGQNRFAEAETVARQAMALHSNSFSANFVLGSVLVNQGKLSDEAKIKCSTRKSNIRKRNRCWIFAGHVPAIVIQTAARGARFSLRATAN